MNKNSKNELDNVANQLIDTYNIENGYLMVLAGNYEMLTEKINDKIAAQQKEKIENAKRIKETAFDTLTAKATATSNSKKAGSQIEDEVAQGVIPKIKYVGGQILRPVGVEEKNWYTIGPHGGFIISRGAAYEKDVGEDIVAKRLRESGIFNETTAYEFDGQNTKKSTGSFVYNYSDNPG